MKPEPTVLVCTGSHCRKKLGRASRLERSLARLPARVAYVGCQKVCDGPVVGVEVDGRLEWFARMDKPKAVAALETLIDSGEVKKPLRRRRSRERAGRFRPGRGRLRRS